MEAARNPWPALGTLLVRDGTITPEQHDLALEEKCGKPELRLGEIFGDLGFALRAAVSRVLAEPHELEFVELDFPSIELRLLLGLPVKLCVAAPNAIDLDTNRAYDGASIDIEEVVTDATETEDDSTVLDHDTPAVVFINRSISKALDPGASDIHVTPQQKRLFVRIRVDGVMRGLTSIAGSQGEAPESLDALGMWLRSRAALEQIVLVYSEPAVPVLMAIAEEPVTAMCSLLRSILYTLSPRLYVHVTASLLETLAQRYVVEARSSSSTAPQIPARGFLPRIPATGRYVGIRRGGRLACVAEVHVYSPEWRVIALGNVTTLPELRGQGLAQGA